MTQIIYPDNFPKIEFEEKEYYQIGCKKCKHSNWNIYSNGVDFIYGCKNCPNMDKIRLNKLQREPDNEE